MFDVVHIDPRNRQTLVAASLAREEASELACSEARRRGIGRMFLTGSEPPPRSELIVIVEARGDQRAA